MEAKKNKTNTGKIFENAVKTSIPSYCLMIRIPDPPQSFAKASTTRFSRPNPCDYICYDSNNGILYCLELKTTSSKSMGFESIYDNDGKSRMIHKHQTLSLLEFSKFNGVVSGFLFNFRHFEGTSDYVETTWFMNVKDFQRMCDSIDKKSFNEIDAALYGAKRIDGTKKITRFGWDMDGFFKSYAESIK